MMQKHLPLQSKRANSKMSKGAKNQTGTEAKRRQVGRKRLCWQQTPTQKQTITAQKQRRLWSTTEPFPDWIHQTLERTPQGQEVLNVSDSGHHRNLWTSRWESNQRAELVCPGDVLVKTSCSLSGLKKDPSQSHHSSIMEFIKTGLRWLIENQKTLLICSGGGLGPGRSWMFWQEGLIMFLQHGRRL